MEILLLHETLSIFLFRSKSSLRLRSPCGAQDEFLLAATAQNLRKLAKLVLPTGPRVTQEA